MTHDTLIIGGGSAGFAAARTARAEGANVGIIDQGPLGGLCILKGCMPTKTILRSSDLLALMHRAEEFGLSCESPKAHLRAIMDRKAKLVREFADDRIQALQGPAYTLYQDRAWFRSSTEVQAGSQVIRANTFIIATGSIVSRPPIPGLEELGYLTSDEALELRTAPKSLCVLGGGPVAVEFAQFYQRLGVQVALIQRSSHILSGGDEDLAGPVEDRFRAEGMRVYTNTQLLRCRREGTFKVVDFLHQGEERTEAAECILLALGRRPNIDGLALESAGIRTDMGKIVVDEAMRTSQPHVFAVGDVNGLHDIVHIAIQQGEIAGWNAVHPDEPPRHYDDRLSMQVAFTDPQVASIGLSERACRTRSLPYLVASHPFNDHGKSIIFGETTGHVKILCTRERGEIIGGHIVGPDASELIHELAAIMFYRGTVFDLLNIPHYHPTLTEILTYPAEELSQRLASTLRPVSPATPDKEE